MSPRPHDTFLNQSQTRLRGQSLLPFEQTIVNYSSVDRIINAYEGRESLFPLPKISRASILDSSLACSSTIIRSRKQRDASGRRASWLVFSRRSTMEQSPAKRRQNSAPGVGRGLAHSVTRRYVQGGQGKDRQEEDGGGSRTIDAD